MNAKNQKAIIAILEAAGVDNPLAVNLMIRTFDESKNMKVEPKEQPTILDIAKGLIYGPRNATYRHPSENFTNIANLWNAYLQAISVRPDAAVSIHVAGGDVTINTLKLNSVDVAYMNILQKVARGATNQQHEDTVIDVAGYAGCIERITKNR